MSYSKQDVQFHSDGYRDSRPAVNVKHYPDFEKDVSWDEFNDAEFKAWALRVLGYNGDYDLHNTAWEVGAENCWETVQEDAYECFRETAPQGNASVKVWSQGRSAGWAVVDGLKDFDSWNAIDLSAWRRFEKWAKQDARGLAFEMVSFLHLNVWDDYRSALSADALALVGA
jgi:hypothetical protein